jgi:hypothetical protein
VLTPVKSFFHVLETEPARQLGERGIGAADRPAFHELRDLLVQQIRVLDVSFVESEMNGERIVADPHETGEIPLLGRITLLRDGCHEMPPGCNGVRLHSTD